jgi:hypothetical protein
MGHPILEHNRAERPCSNEAKPTNLPQPVTEALTGREGLPDHGRSSVGWMNSERGINNLAANQIVLRRGFSPLGILALTLEQVISLKP